MEKIIGWATDPNDDPRGDEDDRGGGWGGNK
jgi:hypothetical protein